MEAEILKSELPSLKELLESPICGVLIQKKFEKIRSERAKMLSIAPAGVRMKRTAYDVFLDAKMLTPFYFCMAYERIIDKRSKLAARERKFIKEVVNSALIEVVIEMNKK